MLFDIVIVVVLLVIAIAMLILELFFLPGFSVAGIFSVIFYGIAYYFAFAFIGITAGVIALSAAVVLSILAIWYFMHSRALDKMSLHTNIEATAPTEVDTRVSVGDEGVSLSRLNPMGRVLLGESVVEARSLEFIDEGVKVRVIKVERTTVEVEPLKSDADN